MVLSRSAFESALLEQGITQQKMKALPQKTQEVVLRMMDAYSQGNQQEGFRIGEAEKDRLARDREELPMKEYLIALLQLDNIHLICRALVMKQRILSHPFKQSQN